MRDQVQILRWAEPADGDAATFLYEALVNGQLIRADSESLLHQAIAELSLRVVPFRKGAQTRAHVRREPIAA